jgi:hypothetical protein
MKLKAKPAKAHAATSTPPAATPRRPKRTSAEVFETSVSASLYGARLHVRALSDGTPRESGAISISLPWHGVAVLLDFADRLLAAADLTRECTSERPREVINWPEGLERADLWFETFLPRFVGPSDAAQRFKLNFAPEFKPEPSVGLVISAARFRHVAWELRWRFQQHALLATPPSFFE